MRRAARDTSRFANVAKALLVVLLLCMASLCLTACSGDGGGSGAGSKAVSDSTSGPAFEPKFLTAKYNDDDASGGSSARIDTSSVSSGYVAAKAVSDSGLKFQVSKDGSAYNYDLSNTGKAAVFPINMGDGKYTFSILQNTTGNRYALVYTLTVDVKLKSELEPFLRPNTMCNYNKKSECVAKAAELTANAGNQGDALAAIYDYVVDNVDYDSVKAASLSGKTGYYPVPDVTLSSKKGICFDYASLTAAMLRSVGIPCKIITGYVTDEDLYHAWNMVYIDGTWQTVKIQVDEKTWTRIDTTYDAGGGSVISGDAENYRDRYVY